MIGFIGINDIGDDSRLTHKPIDQIREKIKENRCSFEVNDPQGNCY